MYGNGKNFGTIPLGLMMLFLGTKHISPSRTHLAIFYECQYATGVESQLWRKAFSQDSFYEKLNWRIIGVKGCMEPFQMKIEQSMLQVWFIMLLKTCGNTAKLEISLRCFVSILPGEELFKHTEHRFLVKGSFGFLGIPAISLQSLSFKEKEKDFHSSGLKKSAHERSY
jgi:hypothetical protein